MIRTRHWEHRLAVRLASLGDAPFDDLPSEAPDWGTVVDENLEIVDSIHQKLSVDREGAREGVPWERKVVIFAAHRFACLYCGAVGHLEIDHVRPVKLGGKSNLENLAPACTGCNRNKKDHRLRDWLAKRPDLSAEAILVRWRDAQRDSDFPERI